MALLQVGVFQVLFLQRSAEDAYAPLQVLAPFVPFRDASCGTPTFHLSVLDCIRVRLPVPASLKGMSSQLMQPHHTIPLRKNGWMNHSTHVVAQLLGDICTLTAIGYSHR